MSVAEELTFHLEDFDGPLELLLALVAKHKMDLHNIPILELIDQYTATVARASNYRLCGDHFIWYRNA